MHFTANPMSTATKALLLQKQDWLRAILDGDGERAKNILATVIGKATTQHKTILKAVSEAFASPIPVRQHLQGLSYLTRLAEEQLVQAGNGITPSTVTASAGQEEGDGSDDGAAHGDEAGDDSDNLTAMFKTPKPARTDKKGRKARKFIGAKSSRRKGKKVRNAQPKTADSTLDEASEAREKSVSHEDVGESIRNEKKKAKKSAQTSKTPRPESDDNKEHNDVDTSVNPPETPKSKKLGKTTAKPTRKAKRSKAEDLRSGEDQIHPKSSPEQAGEEKKRKARADGPETPARSAKKTKHEKTAATTLGQLAMRPRTHSATPGPSNVAPRVKPEPRPAVNNGGQSSVLPKMKAEAEDDLEMFSAPTTPFRQYQPRTLRSGGSRSGRSARRNDHMFMEPNPSIPIRSVENPESGGQAHSTPSRQRSNITNSQVQQPGPVARQPQLQATAQIQAHNPARPAGPPAPAAPLLGAAQPYRDPQGERQYKCRHCAMWFVYSENYHGACLSRHPG